MPTTATFPSLLTASAILIGPAAFAQTITWDGSCGSGHWHTCCGSTGAFDNNWDVPVNPAECPPMPGPGNDVSLGGSDVAHMAAIGVIIKSLGAAGGTFRYLSGFPFTVLENASIASFVAGGTNFTVNGTLSVGGSMDWAGARLILGQPGEVFGSLNISDGGALEGAFSAESGALWDSGGINLASGSVFTVKNAFVIESDSIMNGSGTLRTEGSMVKQATTGSTLISARFENAGGVRLDTGRLRITAGGEATRAFNIGDQTLDFESTADAFRLLPGSSLNGLGNFRKSGFGPLQIAADAGTITASNFELFGSAASLVEVESGSFDITNFKWTAGTVKGPGTTRARFALTLNGISEVKVDGGTFVSEGTGTWSGNLIRLLNGGVFENAGTMTLTRNDTSIENGPNGGTFRNTGTFTKAAGTGRTKIVGVTFENADGATLNIDEGTVLLLGTLTHDGMMNIQSGALLDVSLGGTLELLDGSRIEGNGVVQTFASNSQVLLSGSSSLTRLHIDNGEASGPAALIISNELDWKNGTMRGDGGASAVTTVTSGGTVKITRSGTRTLDGRDLEVFGTTEWTDAGNFILANGATIINRGTFKHDSTGSVRDVALLGRFDNHGTMRRSVAGTGAVSTTIDNQGTIIATAGTLKFTGPGTGDGIWNAAGGSVVLANGDAAFILQSGTRFRGDAVSLNNSRVEVEGEVLFEGRVIADDATIVGPGEVRVTGVLDVRDAHIGVEVQLTIDGSCSIDTADRSFQVLSSRITNNGTTVWKSGLFGFDQFSTFLNIGRFDIQPNAAEGMFMQDIAPNSRFRNRGQFDKASGDNTVTIDLRFENEGGVVVCREGTLRFSKIFSQTSGLVNVLGGTVQFDQPTAISGGAVTGQGFGSKLVGDLNMRGGTVVKPGASPGRLVFEGIYTQETDASLEIAGPTPETEHDVLEVIGTANLGGTVLIKLLDNFTPHNADRFTILTCTTRVGEFDAILAAPTSRNLPGRWRAEYFADHVDLVFDLLPAIRNR